MTTIKKKETEVPALKNLFDDFFDADRFFDSNWLTRWAPKQWFGNYPAANIKESEAGFSVDLGVPGMKREDFNVEIEDGMVRITAEKKEEKQEKGEKFTRKEFSYNSFSRAFMLPKNVKEDKVSAKYENGVLKLFVPKKEPTKSNGQKKIKVV